MEADIVVSASPGLNGSRVLVRRGASDMDLQRIARGPRQQWERLNNEIAVAVVKKTIGQPRSYKFVWIRIAEWTGIEHRNQDKAVGVPSPFLSMACPSAELSAELPAELRSKEPPSDQHLPLSGPLISLHALMGAIVFPQCDISDANH